MKYSDIYKLKKTAADANKASEQRAPGEYVVPALGAIGGGGLGLLLANLIHRRPGKLKKMLYVLAGAGAGGYGAHKALDALSAGEGYADDKSLRYRFRHPEGKDVKKYPSPETKEKMDKEQRDAYKQALKRIYNPLGLSAGAYAGGIIGGARAYQGKGIDFAGLRNADRIVQEFGNHANQQRAQAPRPRNPLGGFEIKQSMQRAPDRTLERIGGSRVLRWILRHPGTVITAEPIQGNPNNFKYNVEPTRWATTLNVGGNALVGSVAGSVLQMLGSGMIDHATDSKWWPKLR